jgi:hypothetical protein
MEKCQKMPNYECKKCAFKCSKLSNYKLHILTNKHKNNVILETMETIGNKMETNITTVTTPDVMESNDMLYCKKCNKIYKTRGGLWKHSQNCSKETNDIISVPSNEKKMPENEKKMPENENRDVNGIMSILKENQDFKNMMIEQTNEYKNIITNQNAMILDLINNNKNTITNNITTNKTVNNQFNLNLFLNETCRDAMNINEFIENIQIQTKELENVGNNGYVTGITDIILSRLKQLDISKRPLHCTDIKRETLYIKDDNEWNRDTEEKTKIKTMITKIAKKNLKQIPVWREQNPECKEPENEKYDFCIKIMRNSLGEIGDEQIKLDDKIIKNIAKQVMVDKNT